MDRPTKQHSKRYLSYAVNAEGQLVGVDSVPTGAKCECYCPACKESLVAKNKGLKRIHHFAHQSGSECVYAVESMLHLLAKEKVRESFLSKSEYWIEFEYKSFCPNSNNCNFIRNRECSKREIKRFDLKKFYDSCEQEKPYDNINRRSDLKIFSSTNPNRKPIYLEFCVTHKSDIEKLHSDNKVIEIKLETEEDVFRLIQNGISETGNYSDETDLDGKGISPNVCFYGFRRSDFNNRTISAEIEFVRYVLYKSGKMQCRKEQCNCKSLVATSKSSLFEMCIHSLTSLNVCEDVKYIGFNKYRIPNCVLCINYVDNWTHIGKICRMYKSLQISRDEKIDTSRAKICPYFKVDKKEMEMAVENGLSKQFTIIKNDKNINGDYK